MTTDAPPPQPPPPASPASPPSPPTPPTPHVRRKRYAGSHPRAFAEPDSKVTSVGYFYRASRRTTMVVLYSMTKNNRFGLGDFGANDLAIVADQDPRGFAIGMRHTS